MIFVTVGAQMPFDRLVTAVDEWAGRTGRTDVFAQIGRSATPPRHIEWRRFVNPVEFRSLVHEAAAIVTHAGMGTLITAMELARPILVMPRRGALRETRNDHQQDTALALGPRTGITVAWNEDELGVALDALAALTPSRRIAAHASIDLLTALRGFIRPGAALPVEVVQDGPDSYPLHAPAAPTTQPERRRAA